MTIWEAIKRALSPDPEPEVWNPDDDDTVRFLRSQRSAARQAVVEVPAKEEVLVDLWGRPWWKHDG